jgi:hypothetical protein
LKYSITQNGNLLLELEPEDKEEVAELYEKATHKDHGFLADLLEYTGWSANGHLYQVPPEAIGALTEAPILTDDSRYIYPDDPQSGDEPQGEADGRIWWFPGYEGRSFGEELLRDGQVIFTYAPPDKKD